MVGCTKVAQNQVQTTTKIVPVQVTSVEQPLYEKRVIISSGYANISAQLSDNPSQRRLMAIRASKIDAYRNLTEKVYGQNINATTTLEEMVTTHDAIRAQVDGVIFGARLVSITPVGSDSYETRLELDESDVEVIRQRFLYTQ
nr:LPP20 family lipoprotein [Marinobacterium sp. xm-d-420]